MKKRVDFIFELLVIIQNKGYIFRTYIYKFGMILKSRSSTQNKHEVLKFRFIYFFTLSQFN